MGDLGTTALFYAAQPRIFIDERRDPLLEEGVLSFTVRETTEGLMTCEITVGNWGAREGGVGFAYFDREALDFGKRLTVEAGDGEAAGQVFAGRITALEGLFPDDRVPELTVLAEDGLQALRMTRRTRLFEDVSDADVMEAVAADHSLTAEIDVDGPRHKALAQVNQSDLAFLRERARAVDAELWIQGETLHVQARPRRRASEVTLTYGKGLRELSVMADLAGQRTAVTVSGWDVTAKEALSFTADVSAIQDELRGESGSDVLEAAFGSREEHIAHELPQSSDEVRALAEARYRQAARRFVRGRGITEGDARIRVGASLRLDEVGEMFQGVYTVTEVTHMFVRSEGFRTTFAIERPSMNGGGS